MQRQLVMLCRSLDIGLQPVCWAATASIRKLPFGLPPQRLEYVACQGLQRGAGSFGGSPRIDSKVTLLASNRASMPNPSLKLSTNGVSRWPSSARPSAYFALAVQRATPLAPA